MRLDGGVSVEEEEQQILREGQGKDGNLAPPEEALKKGKTLFGSTGGIQVSSSPADGGGGTAPSPAGRRSSPHKPGN